MTVQELEKSKLSEIASEYRSKGYTVTIGPTAQDLPDFLSAYQIDLLAKSPHENVVLEISSGTELHRKNLVGIAESVNAQPNWRFEVVVVNPPSAPDVPLSADLADQEQIQSSLKNAETLQSQGQLEAAALLAWSAAEAILRTWARTAGLDLDRKSSSSLLKNLYSAGRLDPVSFAKLQDLLEFRNAFAHGFRARLDRGRVTELIGEVSRLVTAA